MQQPNYLCESQQLLLEDLKSHLIDLQRLPFPSIPASEKRSGAEQMLSFAAMAQRLFGGDRFQ
jgi:hypothetical protein